MRKIFESIEEKNQLREELRKLKGWLYKSNGLGLMETIDKIFLEQGWEQKISFKEVANFNKGLDLLKKTDIDKNWMQERMKWKFPEGIENEKLVKDEFGEWHYVNKLNTNYDDLSDMISEMVMRSIEVDAEKGRKAYNDLMQYPKKTLLSWKPYMKKLLEKYFIELGNGLDDFKKFTKYSKKFSDIGEAAEDKIVNLLEENEFTISYQGGNGDFIDMVFGVDLIVFREDFGYKTIQVKNYINWESVEYYKVDWIASGKLTKIFDKKTKNEVDLSVLPIDDIFKKASETYPE